MMEWLFGKRRKAKEVKIAEMAREATIEIVAHKEAQHEIVQKAERVNKELKELIEENGFHVAIYLASGGKLKTEKQRKRKGAQQ